MKSYTLHQLVLEEPLPYIETNLNWQI